MKKVKKFLGLGRKKNEQQSPSRSRVVACASAPGALICSGCDGYDLQSKDLSKLHRAAAEGDLGELQHLLQKHDLNEQDKGGRTPLHFASANGYIDIVTFLVENKCQLDICDKEKRTPLIKAVECQQEFCAIYLLEHGADPNVKDIDNNTALHFAACNSNVSLAKCLLEKKADIEAQNKDGCTPLIVAVAENNREMVEFLLQQKASVHATDKLGRIPLLIAVPNKNRDLTHILLFHGSNVAHRDKSGWSAKEYAMINDDSILKQYVAKYSDYKNRQEGSFDGQKVLSILRNPEKDGDTGITLGAPAKNKEGFVLNRKIDREVQELLNKSGRDSRKGVTVATVIDNHSSGDSVSSSEKADDDSWLSSEEELGCSPKKPEKPSLAQLMKVPWDFLKNLDEKDCTIQTELLGGSQQNKADYEFEECNESLPKPLFQVKTFPHSVHSSPGSFSKCSQRTLHSKQEKSSKDEEGDEQNTANKKSIVCRQSWNLSPKAKSTLGMDKDEEEKCTESPWDSECTSESPRKLTISSLPTSPAKIGIHMHSIIEEPFNGKPGFQQKITKENLVCESPAPVLKKAIIEKQKSDLMEELGLDEADDIEDTSDWDSTSISLKSTPCVKPSDMLMLEDHVSPQHLIETNIAPEISVPVKEDSDTQNIISSKGQQYIEHKIVKEFKSKGKIEEEKIKKELESKGKKIANAEKLAVNNDEKIEQKHSINEIQHITADSISPADKKEVICLGSSSLKATRKSENKRRNSKQKVSQQLCNNLHQPQDESSLSEASLEERYPAKSVNGKNKLYRTLSITNDLDDLTPSSDSAAEDIESLSSIYKEAIVLIEELSLDCKDSVSLLKVQNIFHGYERLIEHEKGRYTQLLEKVKKFENQRNEWQKNLEDLREMKSILDHQKVQYESEITNLKFCLKQEEETRKGAVMLHEKNQEQLRKKDEQYCTQMEEKQQLELMLRSKEMELKTLTNHLKQVEEERNETQRQLCQEQNARAIQEDILNTHFWRQKELEEESKKVASKHSEMIDNHDHEKELLHRNQILQDELGALKLELDRIRIQHQEDESKYLEENESLKEKNEELKKELKLNEDALTQTVFQYNGQINVSKTEVAMVASKLEHMKENKERLEIELDSLRCRLSSALQEVDRCQVSKSDLERLLQREKDEWLRLKDKLNHDVCTLRETNSSLSQQLGKAESKANSLENELHHANHSLREKNLLLDSIQKDVNQSQCQVKELENAQQIAKDQINKFVIKQESMQERLAQVQSENLLLRQQLEDFQNKGIIKEKVVTDVQDKFSDIFNKLRADTEKQVQMMEERNKELITKCNNLKDQVIKYESEKIDRESIIRQLQQELADSLKKQSMTEASLEVSTRYRIDLEEDKQQLLKEVERMKCKLQDSEVQTIQCERSTHELRHALDIKEREASAASQKLQDFLVASSGTNNAIKQLEEHIQRLEIENARLEATTNQQSNRIEILQKDLQDSVSVHNRLEELITSLQAAKINLEEQLNHQVQKENMLSVTAQGAQNMWEEELKLKSKLGIRLSELDKEKTEIISQFENEKKKVKKVLELKRSVELRLDQEMKRNSELQKEYHGMKKLLKITKKKLKGYESGESSSQISLHGEIKNKYSEIDNEVGKLRKRVDELSHHLEIESTRCTQLESTNCELSEQLASMKTLHKNHEKLEKSKLQLEEEVANLKRQVQDNLINLSQVEQYKTEIEERARKDIRQKLEEVNFFLQTQAASQETLEQIRATNNASLRNQLENRIKELETELAKLKNSQQDSILQKESTHTELEKYKGLYSEELKIRKSLGSKLDRANAKLAEASTQLYHERHKNKSLLANSFLSGSLSSSPVLETVHMGNLGNNLALNKSLNLGGGFLNTNGTALASKNRMEAYLAKMQMELEKSIIKELDQAKAEFDAGSVRVSPVGSVDGSSKKSNIDQDQVSKARQQYLDVLKKNYMI
ncbi:ankyrin repeat domain-containing protein 26 isoform X11 [Crotalus tigris]|uniref:ankyrin repeat domain-containing protein 26 isoform X11 n=1 Tax=Crotalus tigris TaxID=88082 RepID=UPI00192F1E1C|nr:ankyrin repeat domain-containing protein 26 isoform X11 [Crotalus tigris]